MAVTILTAIALAALYIVIFFFSDQDAETSGNTSLYVSQKCVEIYDDVTNQNWNEEVRSRLAVSFEHPLRKIAHFTEYTCMSILLYVLWRQWMERGRKLFGLVICWVFVSAGLDELHQLLAMGRSCSIRDVLLDTCGGLFGFLLCVLAERAARGRRIKRIKRVRK